MLISSQAVCSSKIQNSLGKFSLNSQTLLNTFLNNLHLLAAHVTWPYLKGRHPLRIFSIILMKKKVNSARYKNLLEILQIQHILRFFISVVCTCPHAYL